MLKRLERSVVMPDPYFRVPPPNAMVPLVPSALAWLICSVPALMLVPPVNVFEPEESVHVPDPDFVSATEPLDPLVIAPEISPVPDEEPVRFNVFTELVDELIPPEKVTRPEPDWSKDNVKALVPVVGDNEMARLVVPSAPPVPV